MMSTSSTLARLLFVLAATVVSVGCAESSAEDDAESGGAAHSDSGRLQKEARIKKELHGAQIKILEQMPFNPHVYIGDNKTHAVACRFVLADAYNERDEPFVAKDNTYELDTNDLFWWVNKNEWTWAFHLKNVYTQSGKPGEDADFWLTCHADRRFADAPEIREVLEQNIGFTPRK